MSGPTIVEPEGGLGAGDDAALARDLEAAAELLRGRSIAFLTGAGVSTDSGIPDYRGRAHPPARR